MMSRNPFRLNYDLPNAELDLLRLLQYPSGRTRSPTGTSSGRDDTLRRPFDRLRERLRAELRGHRFQVPVQGCIGNRIPIVLRMEWLFTILVNGCSPDHRGPNVSSRRRQTPYEERTCPWKASIPLSGSGLIRISTTRPKFSLWPGLKS